jgi:hypothetical protein
LYFYLHAGQPLIGRSSVLAYLPFKVNKLNDNIGLLLYTSIWFYSSVGVCAISYGALFLLLTNLQKGRYSALERTYYHRLNQCRKYQQNGRGNIPLAFKK